jgi:hypothetical protein
LVPTPALKLGRVIWYGDDDAVPEVAWMPFSAMPVLELLVEVVVVDVVVIEVLVVVVVDVED